MNFVEPIRDRKKTAQSKNLLRGERHFYDLLLFMVGINTALRVFDLLCLRIGHFMDDRQAIRKRFQIKEQKPGKRHEAFLLPSQLIPHRHRPRAELQPAHELQVDTLRQPREQRRPMAH